MVSDSQIGWALIFLIVSGISLGFSSWRAKVLKIRNNVRGKERLVSSLGLRILALGIIVIVYGIPCFYLAKQLLRR
jgi:hypothetical protein